MFSTLTQRGAATTLDALARGANDYVTKPANVGSIAEGLKRLQDDLIPKIKLHYHNTHRPTSPALSPLAPGPSPTTAPRPSALAFRPPLPTGPAAPIDAVCIGCSTGGPNALVELFAHLPPHPPTPFFIVQHMPPLFTAMLAERLGKVSALRFYEAKHDQTIEPGCVYVAPGGHHLEIRRDARGTPKAFLHDDAAENSCRPAVDVLFRSAAAAYGCNCLGVILTGMGQDGLRGCELLREKNARILAQDEATSVVWGMPGAVTHAGLAEKVLPLNQIAGEISRRLNLPRPILAAASRS
jgi:two-component system chemotaxis response regulator CheB